MRGELLFDKLLNMLSSLRKGFSSDISLLSLAQTPKYRREPHPRFDKTSALHAALSSVERSAPPPPAGEGLYRGCLRILPLEGDVSIADRGVFSPTREVLGMLTEEYIFNNNEVLL
jgi:hypothetical protein